MAKDVKTAAFVILEKYLDATDENVNKELIVNAMIEYAELRLSKELALAETSHESSGLNKPDVIKSVCEKCEGKGDYYEGFPGNRRLSICECQKQTVL